MPHRFHTHNRLPGHDYTRGTYFITLSAWHRTNIFGRILGTGADAAIELNDAGRVVNECWHAIPNHFPHARLDEFQIMPDHLHAILILSPPCSPEVPVPSTHRVDSGGNVPDDPIGSTQWVDGTDTLTNDRVGPKGPRARSLGAIIGAFKSETTKRINRLNGVAGRRVWLAGYHERAIRQRAGEYERIAQYITENPTNWR